MATIRGAKGRQVALGLAIALATFGCGRAGLQEAPPASVTLTAMPVSTPAPTAEIVVWNEGDTLRLKVTGQGFESTGAYAIQPLSAYRAGTPPIIRLAADSLPEAVPVVAGRVELLTTFERRGYDGTWQGFGIFHHANGNINDTASGQLMLFAPLPSSLKR